MHLFPKLLFPILLIVPLCSAGTTPSLIPDIYLTSTALGPLSTYQNNIDFEVTVHSKTSNKSFYDYFRAGPNKDDIRYSYYGGLRKLKNFTHILTFNIPTKDLLSLRGMYCVIILKDYYNQYEYNFEFTLHPLKGNKNIKAEDYVSTPFRVSNTSCYFDLFGFHEEDEYIQFPDYLSYLNIDTYHKLTLDSVSFTCETLDTSFTSAYILIPDYQNVFPYITHNQNHQISIPLELIQNEESFTFAYKNRMYVNPKNGQMSLLPKEGFTVTKNFYFPMNEKEKLVDEKFQIVLNGFSTGKTNITWSLDFLANINLIGDCDNSEYCIIGEEI